MSIVKRILAVAVTAVLLLAPGRASASPPAAIALDLIVGRPAMLLASIMGSAFFVVTLPITAVSGTDEEALERFVVEPAERLTGPIGE